MEGFVGLTEFEYGVEKYIDYCSSWTGISLIREFMPMLLTISFQSPLGLTSFGLNESLTRILSVNANFERPY